jgi:hypothetical protein
MLLLHVMCVCSYMECIPKSGNRVGQTKRGSRRIPFSTRTQTTHTNILMATELSA